MIGYIFGNLQSPENAVKNIKKAFRKQARVNQRVTVLAFVIVAYAVAANIRNQELNNKIEKLSNEIEELKRMKGA